MIAVDAGILAFAANRHAPEHAPASRALEALVNGIRPWALPWPAAYEFLRLVTHPHACARPLGAAEAAGFIDTLLGSPGAHALSPGPRHVAVLRELIAAGTSPVRQASRLELAAVLREHSVRELLSCDAGMRRWAFLTVIYPVHGPPWHPGDRPVRRYRALRLRR